MWMFIPALVCMFALAIAMLPEVDHLDQRDDETIASQETTSSSAAMRERRRTPEVDARSLTHWLRQR